MRKKVLFPLIDKEEMYILNKDGVPKRIPANQWKHVFHKRVVDEDEIGNKKYTMVLREDYLKYKVISLEKYQKMTGLVLKDGRWQKAKKGKETTQVEVKDKEAKE